ncbi:MAG: LacI family DNA-binding transcriptional regulator [Janthinobacterium lividum]
MPRTTISDVARAAGVSKGAASKALNGHKGVSEATRARVHDAAAALGWSANAAARALSGAKAGAVGWALLRSPKSGSVDPYFVEMFSGVELELASTDLSLIVKLVSTHEQEIELYRRWAAERRVDGVMLTDIFVDDPRPQLLQELELPLVMFSTGSRGAVPDPGVPFVWADLSGSVDALLDHAWSLGHQRIGWIEGDPAKAAPGLRERLSATWAGQHDAEITTLFTDHSPEQGAAAALELLARDRPPTFIVFDNDVMALKGLSVCLQAGLSVPGDISLASFVDSPLCAASNPALTALQHPIADQGRAMTRRLIEVISTGDVTDEGTDEGREVPTPTLVARQSTGRAGR